MTVFTWIYLGLLAVALITEGVAIAVKDKPDQRNTITANIRWLVQLHGAWWHNNFGHPMSHGCVNISTRTRNSSWPNAAPNAEYLWNFDNVGDPVVVHGQTPG